MIKDPTFRKLWPEVDWVLQDGVCEELLPSNALASAGSPPTPRFRVSLQYCPCFVDPEGMWPPQYEMMGFRFSAIGVIQGDKRKLPHSVRHMTSRGFGLKLRYEDVHFDSLPFTASHITSGTAAWK